MPTYGNPRTRVVHWIPTPRVWWVQTVCHFLDEFLPSWDWDNLDPVGAPADVTCCKCRETAAWLDALAAGGEKGKDDEP